MRDQHANDVKEAEHAKDKIRRDSSITKYVLATTLGLVLLSGCDSPPADDTSSADTAATSTATVAPPADPMQETSAADLLAAVLDGQTDSIKARFDARHPRETLEFFGITPAMTVVEGDPSGGWYSDILQAYLGSEGTLIGADYPMGVYELFNYYSEEQLAAKAVWSDTWPTERSEAMATGAAVQAYAMGSMPAALEGTADAVVMIRVLHNLADFEAEGAYLSDGLNEVYRVLKPGGVVGIVQHSAPESHSDEWASGANGYLKKSFVIGAMESAGFIFEAESTVNENPLDQPTEDESVWRLAPTSDVEDPELEETYAAIGESTRMTLRFRKPAEP